MYIKTVHPSCKNGMYHAFLLYLFCQVLSTKNCIIPTFFDNLMANTPWLGGGSFRVSSG